MIKTTVLTVLFLLGISSCIAFSQTKTPVINQRERNQRARIHEGVKTGELTRPEARKLGAEEQSIKADKRAAKADGKVTPGERRHLKRELNRSSRDIYRLKHNGRKRD